MERGDVGARISYEPDASYLGADIRLDSVVALLTANNETRALSKRSVYSLLEKAAPGALPSYEDNEEQKEQDKYDEKRRIDAIETHTHNDQ